MNVFRKSRYLPIDILHEDLDPDLDITIVGSSADNYSELLDLVDSEKFEQSIKCPTTSKHRFYQDHPHPGTALQVKHQHLLAQSCKFNF
jgi:hypothetical protein